MKIQGRNSNGKMVKQTAENWPVRAFVTSVVPPHNHARSREQLEMFMISQNPFQATCRSKPNAPGQIQDYFAAANS